MQWRNNKYLLRRRYPAVVVETTEVTIPDPNKMKPIIHLILLMFIVSVNAVNYGTVLAQESTAHLQHLDRIESILQQKKAIDENNLRDYLKTLNGIRVETSTEKTDIEQKIDKNQKQTTGLGEKSAIENKEVTSKRESLANEKKVLEKRLSEVHLVTIRTDELLQSVSQLQTTLLTRRLFSKGPPTTSLLMSALDSDLDHYELIKQYTIYNFGIHQIPLTDFIFLFVAFIVSAAIGVWGRRVIKTWVIGRGWDDSFAHRFWEALFITVAHYFPQFLSTAITAVLCYMVSKALSPLPLVSVFIISLPFYFISLLTIQIFLNPKTPARHILPIPPALSRVVSHALRVALLVTVIAYIILYTLESQQVSIGLQMLVRDFFAVFIIANLAWVVWLVGRASDSTLARWGRAVLLLILFGVVISELLGYRNLAAATFRIAFSLLLAFGVSLLIATVFRGFYDALDLGKQNWHRPIRTAFGLSAGQHFPGLVGFRFVTSLIIWGAFIAAIVQILGFSDTIANQVKTIAIDGFTFGSLTINPARLFFAVMIFALLFTVSSWLKVKLDKSWLITTRIERGAREALITITGYAGVTVATLVALGIAGFTFTNLAIIAGALSVGIGFGLQNIVNNFVSGLILLFERPIRKGDWIVVGATEGYVMNISIRSTQIQTFDRADVIVPNSDLISNQVTNWMLHNQSGRIRVPVGVAYGSDVEKVREILHDIAMADERVIRDQDDYKVRVLFLAFGDSALNFELRCHIHNIDEKIAVISDMNFAINKAFREHNVEIPFPQRDIHIKTN